MQHCSGVWYRISENLEHYFPFGTNFCAWNAVAKCAVVVYHSGINLCLLCLRCMASEEIPFKKFHSTRVSSIMAILACQD
jgi:hypothetical protein